MSLNEKFIDGEQTKYEKFKDRNDLIVIDKKSGMTNVAIAKKNNMSTTNVWLILFHRNMSKYKGKYKWEYQNESK